MDAKIVKKELIYNPDTGLFLRRKRTPEDFSPKGQLSAESLCGSYNTRFANKPALTATTNGYKVGRIRGRNFMAHVAAWAYMHGEWPDGDIDHINGDRSDNRIENLRVVSRSENLRNKGLCARNKSGEIGIYWGKDRNKWRVELSGKKIGSFDTMDDAIVARDKAKIDLGFHPNHGERQAYIKSPQDGGR